MQFEQTWWKNIPLKHHVTSALKPSVQLIQSTWWTGVHDYSYRHFLNFNLVLHELLDSSAPAENLESLKKNLMSRLNEELMNLRRDCGTPQLHWQCSWLEAFPQAWKDTLSSFQLPMYTASTAYSSNLIISHQHNLKFLFVTGTQLPS